MRSLQSSKSGRKDAIFSSVLLKRTFLWSQFRANSDKELQSSSAPQSILITDCDGPHISYRATKYRVCHAAIRIRRTGTKRPISPVEKAHFLETLQVTLNACHLIDAPVLPNRVVKAVLPLLTVILNPTSAKKDGPEQGGSKNSRKRARNYEGDEVFKTTRDVLCPSFVEGKVLLNALEGKFLYYG